MARKRIIILKDALPAIHSSRVIARTCVPRVSLPTRACNKKGIRSASKNILWRMSRRLFVDFWRIRGRSPAPTRNRVQILFRDVLREDPSFPHIWLRPWLTQPQETSCLKRCNFAPRRELLSFRLCRRSCGPMKCQLIFIGYTVWRDATSSLRIDLRNYRDAWNITQLCEYVWTISN